MITKITNAKLLLDTVCTGLDLYMENGKITAISDRPLPYDMLIDAEENYVSPGFIDIHNHGGDGFEFEDGTEEAVRKSAALHFAHGTTTLFPTLSATGIDTVYKALEAIKKVMEKGDTSAYLAGVHMEGPYLSAAQTGAQDASCIVRPRKEEYVPLLSKYGDIIKRWTYAPEVDNALEFQTEMNRWGIVTSAGHTDAVYDDFYAAYKKGCRLVTHLYSCTSTVSRENGYRRLGVIESAFLLKDVTAELICDGCHLPPELIRMIYDIKGREHVCLVTDCIRYGGYTGDEVIEGGTENVPYIIEDGVAKLTDRSAFAGSIATADILIRTVAKKAGIGILDAVKMMTEVPARIMGLSTKGKLLAGYDADIVIFDDNIEIKKVIRGQEDL